MSFTLFEIITIETQQLSYAISKGWVKSVFVHSHTVQ